MEPFQKASRHKRLKIGRACYTCRAKKIKCDGLRPCMQVPEPRSTRTCVEQTFLMLINAARNRPCTFYKDGSFDPDDQPEDVPSATPSYAIDDAAGMSSVDILGGARSGDLQSINSDQDGSAFLFADIKDSNYARNKRRGPPIESRTSNELLTLGDDLLRINFHDHKPGRSAADKKPFGSFLKWIPEPALPGRYAGSIEMPSRDTQMIMINLWFQQNYEALPIIPKRYFYEQLRCKGPFITPLLLNAIYALASRLVRSLPDLPKPDVFFHRAKRLIDDFMDVPRVSTVVALCYMSLYEPVPSTHRNGSPYCRSWMYSGMAYRMCLELGLHNQANISKELKEDEIEMRRRVFWACYNLDKFQSGGWERPCMLSIQAINTDLPRTLPDDDSEEQLIVQALVEKIKFAQLIEGVLSRISNQEAVLSPLPQSRDPAAAGDDDENNNHLQAHKAELLLRNYAEALQKLPTFLQWTPTSMISVEDVLQLPVPRPMVAHLHLCFTQCILGALFRAPNSAYNEFQRQLMATCVTQLVHFMCEKPGSIVKCDFVIHALLSAIKVHVKLLKSSDATIAHQSWTMLDKSVKSIHILRGLAVIPNSAKFLQQLENSIEQYRFQPSSLPISHHQYNQQRQRQEQQQQQQQSRPASSQMIQPSHLIPLSNMDIPRSDDRSLCTAVAQHQGMSTTSSEEEKANEYVVMSMNSHDWTTQQQQRPVMSVGSAPSSAPDTHLVDQMLAVHGMMVSDNSPCETDYMIRLPHLVPYVSSSPSVPSQQQRPSQQKVDLYSPTVMSQQQYRHDGSI